MVEAAFNEVWDEEGLLIFNDTSYSYSTTTTITTTTITTTTQG